MDHFFPPSFTNMIARKCFLLRCLTIFPKVHHLKNSKRKKHSLYISVRYRTWPKEIFASALCPLTECRHPIFKNFYMFYCSQKNMHQKIQKKLWGMATSSMYNLNEFQNKFVEWSQNYNDFRYHNTFMVVSQNSERVEVHNFDRSIVSQPSMVFEIWVGADRHSYWQCSFMHVDVIITEYCNGKR